MTDINQKILPPFHKRTRKEDEALRQAIEMLFFAYRDFTSGPDEIHASSGSDEHTTEPSILSDGIQIRRSPICLGFCELQSKASIASSANSSARDLSPKAPVNKIGVKDCSS